jgi:hypothetical protein
MKKVLVFSSREICYFSGNFFAHQLAAAFEEIGCQTDFCEFTKEDDLDACLMPYVGQEYAAIIDFNSMLPQLVLEDDTPYLDCLSGPFFNYVLDHPLFHYNMLNGKAQNIHALVLDDAQRDYVAEYYPKVKSVHTLPLGATKALYEGEKNAECRIFFPGTYDKPEAVYEIIEASPDPLKDIMKLLAERRIAEPLAPMEQLFRQILWEKGMELTKDKFALFMNAMYAVDAYVRDYFRKKVLDELLDAELPVTIMGSGWEKYDHRNVHCLKREKEVPFALSFEKIAKEHILLNVSPIFNRGMHDRIPAGMANHTVVLTDSNPYLQEHFTDGKEICMYSLTAQGDVVDKAAKLLESEERRVQIAKSAYSHFEENDTWHCRAKEILRIAERVHC